MDPSDSPLDPADRGRAHLAAAYRLYEADDFEAALAACDAALACLPMLAEAHNLRGAVLEELEREAEAIAAYQEALLNEPNFGEARDNLAQIEAEHGHLAEAYRRWEDSDFAVALTACDAALEIIPFSAEAHNLRGVLLEELGRPLEALRAYASAVRLDPSLADGPENLQGLCETWGARFGLTSIATSDYPLTLHILKGRLEAEGIPAFVADEELITVNWLYARALGGARLQVWRQDAQRAMEILGIPWPGETPEAEEGSQAEWEHEYRAGDSESAEVVTTSGTGIPLTWEELSALAEDCTHDPAMPPVGAAQGDEPIRCPECRSASISWRRYHERLVFLTWLLLDIPLPILKRRWRCLACGHEWRLHP